MPACGSCGHDVKNGQEAGRIAYEKHDAPICTRCWTAPWSSWNTLYMRILLQSIGKPVADVAAIADATP